MKEKLQLPRLLTIDLKFTFIFSWTGNKRLTTIFMFSKNFVYVFLVIHSSNHYREYSYLQKVLLKWYLGYFEFSCHMVYGSVKHYYIIHTVVGIFTFAIKFRWVMKCYSECVIFLKKKQISLSSILFVNKSEILN